MTYNLNANNTFLSDFFDMALIDINNPEGEQLVAELKKKRGKSFLPLSEKTFTDTFDIQDIVSGFGYPEENVEFNMDYLKGTKKQVEYHTTYQTVDSKLAYYDDNYIVTEFYFGHGFSGGPIIANNLIIGILSREVTMNSDQKSVRGTLIDENSRVENAFSKSGWKQIELRRQSTSRTNRPNAQKKNTTHMKINGKYFKVSEAL
jgi:hypothetical protein